MSLAPFAAIEARVNRVVFERLSNAIAAADGGPDFGVIFDATYADPFGPGVVDTTQSQCIAPLDRLQGLHQGSALTVGGARYRIERIEPDGAGAALVVLSPWA